MNKKLLIPLAAMLLVSLSYAGDADDGMPLSVYQKLKGHFDALYGPRTAMLPGTQRKKEDIEKDLRADAAANKEVLLKALASKSVIHRDLAARALEYCGDKKAAVDALCRVVTDDTDESIRRAAAATLAKLPDAAAVEALIKGLGDSADPVRGICATALGNIKDNRACTPLLKVLSDEPKPIVRMQAATALSKIKDPASLDGLKKALEGEKDERVKMAIAGAMRNIIGAETTQTEDVPSAQDCANELGALSKEMKEVEDKLRNDRHDQAVQVQGNDIEKRLGQMIEKLQKASSSSSSSGQGDKKQQSQQQQKGSGGGKSGGSPLNNSQLGQATPPGAVNPAAVDSRQDAWAKLPPALRDEIKQTYSSDIPVRWRARVAAYILSIIAEDAKNTDK